MSLKRYSILLLLLLTVNLVRAHEVYTDFHFYFRPESAVLDSTYMNNAEQMQVMRDFMDYLYQAVELDSTLALQGVVIRGEASPEGSEQLNRRLVSKRVLEVENMVRQTINVPDSLITHLEERYIDWEYLKQQVATSDIPQKEEVLRILEQDTTWVKYHLRGERMDSRVAQLQKVDNGRAWKRLLYEIFPPMRNGGVLFITNKVVPDTIYTKAIALEITPTTIPAPLANPYIIMKHNASAGTKSINTASQDSVTGTSTDTILASVDTITNATNTPPPPAHRTDTADTVITQSNSPENDSTATTSQTPNNDWQSRITLKTNAIGWAFAVANIALEADLAQHWSINLPFYYSAWNYFVSTIKLKTLILQPEVRYWFNEDNEQWFIGAHFGVAWYNVAWNGDYRYQDQGWDKPGLGGGIDAGYRMPLSKRHPNWKVEFSLGIGVYDMRYDKILNSTDNFLMTQQRKAFFCIDHAAISFSYSFDIKKKGGNK